MNEMMLKTKLSSLGITLNTLTGHISYAENFNPLALNFDLIFIRHGETYGNCGQTTADAKIDYELVKLDKKDYQHRIFQGNVDTEINQLTHHGKKQALNVAYQLENDLLAKGWKPDIIFYSPLTRAKETAVPFIERNKLNDIFLSLDDIREMSFGSWDNRRVSDMKPDDPCHAFYKNQHALVKNAGKNGSGTTQEAENFCEVLLRAYSLLQQINTHFEGKKIIMFSHSMFGAACNILLGKGRQYENSSFLAFDGKCKNGESYTLPNATPCYLNMRPEVRLCPTKPVFPKIKASL